MESQDGSSSSKPAPVRPVNLAEVRRKLSSSGAAHPQLGKVPTSPTSPTLAQAGEQWSSDENKSPVLGSTNATVPNSPPQQHQAPLAAISETDDAGDSDDDEDEGEEEERQHGMKGLYSETAIKYGYLMKKGERRKVSSTVRLFVYGPNARMCRTGRSATLYFEQTDSAIIRMRKSTSYCVIFP